MLGIVIVYHPFSKFLNSNFTNHVKCLHELSVHANNFFPKTLAWICYNNAALILFLYYICASSPFGIDFMDIYVFIQFLLHILCAFFVLLLHILKEIRKNKI